VIKIRPARFADAEAILPLLRLHDQKTIERLGLDPLSLLKRTFDNGSPIFVATNDGVPACMWGIEKKTLLSPWMLWMLTTSFVDKNPIRFLRESRRVMQKWSAEFGTIEGLVDSNFAVSVRWLRWLGFRPVAEGDFIRMRYP
jgi:hypothetical protein